MAMATAEGVSSTEGAAIRIKLLRKCPSSGTTATLAQTSGSAKTTPTSTAHTSYQGTIEKDEEAAAGVSNTAVVEATAQTTTPEEKGIKQVKVVDNPVVTNWLKLVESEMEVFVPDTT